MTRKDAVQETDMEPKFIADCMLGTLAKRLRLLGYDTLFYCKIEDEKIVEIAVTEDRIILTRDNALLRRKAVLKGIFIDSDDLEDQMKKVISECGLKTSKAALMSRCLVCNTPLNPMSKRETIGRVPPFVFLKHSRFNYCSGCNKIYWAGSHMKNVGKIKKSWEESTDGKNV